MNTTLIVPGLHGSGVDHWQTWLERQLPDAVRVVQRDWDVPDLQQWSWRLQRDIERVPGNIWIVAHSFGCLAAVHVTAEFRERISGLMLVAPADPEKFGVDDIIPDGPLGVPTVLVASTNDPWMSLRNASGWADAWGAELINVGAAGHINPHAGFGPWPRGLAIYRTLRHSTTHVTTRAPTEDFLITGEI